MLPSSFIHNASKQSHHHPSTVDGRMFTLLPSSCQYCISEHRGHHSSTVDEHCRTQHLPANTTYPDTETIIWAFFHFECWQYCRVTANTTYPIKEDIIWRLLHQECWSWCYSPCLHKHLNTATLSEWYSDEKWRIFSYWFESRCNHNPEWNKLEVWGFATQKVDFSSSGKASWCDTHLMQWKAIDRSVVHEVFEVVNTLRQTHRSRVHNAQTDTSAPLSHAQSAAFSWKYKFSQWILTMMSICSFVQRILLCRNTWRQPQAIQVKKPQHVTASLSHAQNAANPWHKYFLSSEMTNIRFHILSVLAQCAPKWA